MLSHFGRDRDSVRSPLSTRAGFIDASHRWILRSGAMESSPFLPDPAQIHFPLGVLSPVSHALCDLAHSEAERQKQPQQEELLTSQDHEELRLDSSTSSSTSHIAQRLASLIRRLSNADVKDASADSVPGSDDFSQPSPCVLALELAAISAIGCWADSFLPETVRRSVCRSLSSSLFSFAEAYIPHPDVQSSCMSTLSSPADARRAVFRMALSKRYGNLPDAPSAMTIAGAPYVLYVHQALASHKEKGEGFEEGQLHPSTEFEAWRALTEGTVVLEHVAVPAEEVTRAAVAAKLKNAVSKRALSPTLMIVDAALDSTLCAAADLLRAVCDTYGMHMHVEGNALSMILAGNGMKNLLYNVGDLVTVAHSATLDIANWFGHYRTAVLLFCKAGIVDEGMIGQGAPGALSAFMSLGFFVQRVRLPRCAELLRAACEHTGTLTESLFTVPHLIECKTVGCGESVFISYAALESDTMSHTVVNRAMWWNFQRRHIDMQALFTIANHENREWLLFSPCRVLTNNAFSVPCSAEAMKDICKELIYATRRCEVVLKGKAAFMSEMRQCQDVEVEMLAPQRQKDGFSPLFFAALRVTPFGEVSRNGHWRKDEEMTAKVEKSTVALASLLQSNPADDFEAFLRDADIGDEVPVVCIGPMLPDLSVNRNAGNADCGDPAVSAGDLSIKTMATYAEDWDLDELAAQKSALRAAASVIAAVHTALSTGTEASSRTSVRGNEGDKGFLTNHEGEKRDEVSPVEVPCLPEIQVDGTPLEGVVEDTYEPTHASDEVLLSNGQPEIDAATTVRLPHEETGEDATQEAVGTEKNLITEATELPQQKSSDSEQRKQSRSFWDLLFGDDTREDAESSSGTESPNALEDDYFRP